MSVRRQPRALFSLPFAVLLAPSALAQEAPVAAEIEPAEAPAKPPPAPPAVSFKPGKGLRVESADGRFGISLGMRLQFRYELDLEQGDDGLEGEHAFMIRRGRVNLGGHLFGPHNTFKIQFAFSPDDLGMKEGVVTLSPLLDAYLELDHLQDFTVRFGQYKVTYDLENIRSSGALSMVERSIANAEFRLDRDVGFQFSSDDLEGIDHLRYALSLMVGEGASSFLPSDFGLLYVARVEVFPLGISDDYMSEPDLTRSSRVRLALGGAYAFLDEGKGNRGIKGSTPGDGGTTDFHNVTADLSLHVAGFSLESAFYWRQGLRNPGPLVDDQGQPLLDDDGDPLTVEAPRDGYGVHAQASMFMPRVPIEVAARYAHVDGLGTQSSLTEKSTLGASLGGYFAGHHYKLQADYDHSWTDDGLAHGADQVHVQLQASL